MISLPNVTLILVSGPPGYDVDDAVVALKHSQKGIEFGEVKFIQLGSITGIDSWSKSIVYDMHKYVDTDFALLIHENGFVVNPESWDDDWLNYDFVGAPWPLPSDPVSYRDVYGNIVRVGNSVSIRSKRLMELPSKLDMEWKEYYGNHHEDGFICCHNRHLFEGRGMSFAPLEVAKWFGRELEMPENADVDKPFVFHRNKVNPGRNVEFDTLYSEERQEYVKGFVKKAAGYVNPLE